MKVALSWLKDYVDIDVSAQELQEKLFSCGFEVEELIYIGSEINNCVVGQITKIEKHPDADKLSVCQVNLGEKGCVQIVTAATNMKEGDKVPVALDNSTLHGGVKIKKCKMRGVDSMGMFCSGEEFGINDDYYPNAEVNGLLILDKDTPLGEDIKKIIGLDDYVFDIGVTANRPDCQCVIGIAREVAAVLGKKIKYPSFDFKTENFKTSDFVTINVEAKDLCPRYVGHYVSDIKIEQSPLWLRRRLAVAGLRSINNIVDITNFVLLEMGQPMHAFDVSNLEDNQINVRRAKDGERIITLDSKEFTLDSSNLVICDGKKPVALAGIMGGLNSEIKDTTKAVLFESAKFARDCIRKTSRKLGQHSDSSFRYEKGIDAYTNLLASRRALHLIDELGCGKIACENVDLFSEDGKAKVIQTKISKINSILGVVVPTEKIVEILQSLEFKVEANGEDIKVEVPLYREDIDGFPDLAEEVIRMYGYDHIVPTFLPTAKITNGGLNQEQKNENRLKEILISQNLNEIVTYSFISPKDYELLRLNDEIEKSIKIKNPIGEDLSLMRRTLAPSMLNTIVRNLRRENNNGRLFELAKTYNTVELPLKDLPNEDRTLCIGLFGNNEDFFTMKGIIECIAFMFNLKFEYERINKPFLHPGKTVAVKLGNTQVGYFGELAPDIAEELAVDKNVILAELNFEELAKVIKNRYKFSPLPKFSEVKRDLALVVDESMTCGEIISVIKASAKTISSVELFDVYRGEKLGKDKKSMAFTITFKPNEQAFTPENIDNYVNKILKNLKEKLNITLR